VKYLLDTNVVSELVAKQPNPGVVGWVDSIDPETAYLSVITIGEIRKGVEKLADSRRKNTLRAWLSDDLLVRFDGRILTLDVDTMLTWGSLMAALERAGRPLPAVDSLVAALALHHSCSLVTRNEHDFQGAGIPLINPWR
jgi:predicted nucleic acid-binding protein